MTNRNRRFIMPFRCYEGEPAPVVPPVDPPTPPTDDTPAIRQMRDQLNKLNEDNKAKDAELQKFKDSQLTEQEKIVKERDTLAAQVAELSPLKDVVSKYEKHHEDAYKATLEKIEDVEKRTQVEALSSNGDWLTRNTLLSNALGLMGASRPNPEPSRPVVTPYMPSPAKTSGITPAMQKAGDLSGALGVTLKESRVAPGV